MMTPVQQALGQIGAQLNFPAPVQPPVDFGNIFNPAVVAQAFALSNERLAAPPPTFTPPTGNENLTADQAAAAEEARIAEERANLPPPDEGKEWELINGEWLQVDIRDNDRADDDK